MAWDPNEAREEIAKGKYYGYEVTSAQRLKRSIPRMHQSLEDLLAEMRLYALEAVERFLPDKNTSFSTFVYKHLYIRCLQYKNSSWLKRAYPKQKKILSLTAESSDDRSDNGQFPLSSNDLSIDFLFEISELKEHLSDASKEVLTTLVNSDDGNFSKALNKRRLTKVARIANLKKRQLKKFVKEVERLAPTYVTGKCGT